MAHAPARGSRDIDVLIRNGQLVDGTGSPWFYGDLAIVGDRVAEVAPRGAISPAGAAEVVDAGGHVVCPGFIDIQSHSIGTLFDSGQSLSKVTQGVTTEIMGEAWTPAPFGGRIREPFRASLGVSNDRWEAKAHGWTRFRAWLEAVQERGVAVNIGSFLGGGTLREYAMGWDTSTPTNEQVQVMCRVVEEAMRDGAFGVATALIYPPSSFAGTEELVEIARVIGRHGGVYITHVRSEAERLIEGIDEAIDIGRRGDCAVEIYHLKASGAGNWHKMDAVIAAINAARASGVDITADMYPYIASGTGLSVLVPKWLAEGDRLFENLADPALRQRIREEMLNRGGAAGVRRMEHVMPVGFDRPENKQYIGKRLDEIAAMRKQDWVDATIDLLLSERQRISTIYFTMSEENVKKQMQLPWMKISSDAGGHDPATEINPVHPRGYGTYPRVLGKYVRDEKVLSLEDAVRKMTNAVAARLSLSDRGILRAGAYADVVIFNAGTITDHATFTNPHVLSTGIRDVWVNGGRVIANNAATGNLPGTIVDGPGGGGGR